MYFPENILTINLSGVCCIMRIDGVILDEMSGYGPETTTIYDLNGVYKFEVVDFLATGTFQDYGATVKVYLPGQSQPEVITMDPNAGVNVVWEVFELDHGELKILNRAPDEENLSHDTK